MHQLEMEENMSIIEDFQNSSELIMEHDKHGIPLVSINDFDNAIDEIKKLRNALGIVRDNSLNPAHTMTKLGLEATVDCNYKLAVETLEL